MTHMIIEFFITSVKIHLFDAFSNHYKIKLYKAIFGKFLV